MHHLDTKGANRDRYRHSYCKDVQLLSAVFAACRTVLTHCRINLKDFNHKMDNSIIHLPEPLPGHFVLRNSCCSLDFVFNDVKSKTAEWPFFSVVVRNTPTPHTHITTHGSLTCQGYFGYYVWHSCPVITQFCIGNRYNLESFHLHQTAKFKEKDEPVLPVLACSSQEGQ